MQRYFYIGLFVTATACLMALIFYKTESMPVRFDTTGEFGEVSLRIEYATSSYPSVFYPTSPALYVLETTAGFASEHNIATGTPLLLKNFPIVSE
jgi:hypothetical protein